MFRTALQGRSHITSVSRTTLRLLATSPRCFQKKPTGGDVPNKKIDSHLNFLSKYYNQDLLQSIKITESLVDPETVLGLSKKGPNAKSRVAPTNESFDYSITDAKWQEPILYPNQPDKKTPYPSIPNVAAPDNTHLKIRFQSNKTDARPSLRDVAEQQATGIAKLTGLDKQKIRNLYSRAIYLRRVSCQTRKGKIPSFYCLTVVGNKDGLIGLGEGKSRDGMRVAIRKAHWNAIKNLTPIPRYENRTIIGNIDYKFHAVKLSLRSAPAGFGLRVNPNIFEVCQAAGIKDLGGKVFKSRNKMNTVKGFVEALTKQRSLEDLAAGRGKKVLDLRKVYYSA